MDRTALSKRLEGLSQVFASEHPISRDLKAMSHVLANMSEEKFASVLNAAFDADMADKDSGLRGMQPIAPPAGRVERRYPGAMSGSPIGGMGKAHQEKLIAELTGPMSEQEVMDLFKKVINEKKTQGAITPDATPAGAPAVTPAATPVGVREASEEAVTEESHEWTVEASDAVRDALLRDVLGMDKKVEGDTKRHLTPDQVPDGTHKQEKPATLKDPQTPQIKETLDSGIVEKSKGAVRKEAAEEAVPVVEVTKEAAKEVEAPKEAAKEVEVPKEAAKEVEAPKEAAKNQNDPRLGYGKGLKKASEDVYGSEGIELTPPMIEVELSDSDKDALSKLF